jgi:hypothetical protein
VGSMVSMQDDRSGVEGSYNAAVNIG